jgi:hypothetical protein
MYKALAVIRRGDADKCRVRLSPRVTFFTWNFSKPFISFLCIISITNIPPPGYVELRQYIKKMHERKLLQFCLYLGQIMKNYRPCYYTWSFSTQCAVDLVKSTNWDKDCGVCMGCNRDLLLPHRTATTALLILATFLLMRKPETRLKSKPVLPVIQLLWHTNSME